MLTLAPIHHQVSASQGSNSQQLGTLDEYIVVDELNREIMALLYSDITDFSKYNDPTFVLKLKSRALSGIKLILTKINCNAALVGSGDFLLHKQVQNITMKSKKDEQGFLYVKAAVNVSEDINLLEYAIVSGYKDLALRFAQFNVKSTKLEKLNSNLKNILNNLDNNQSKEAIASLCESFLEGSIEYEEPFSDTHPNVLSILLHTRKKAIGIQVVVFAVGMALIFVAVFATNNEVVKLVLFGVAGALFADALQNTANMLMNTGREDIIEQMKLHKGEATALFGFVNTLEVAIDGTIIQSRFIDYAITCSHPAIEQSIIPVGKIVPKTILTFSSENRTGLGLNTNSESTSNRVRDSHIATLRRSVLEP